MKHLLLLTILIAIPAEAQNTLQMQNQRNQYEAMRPLLEGGYYQPPQRLIIDQYHYRDPSPVYAPIPQYKGDAKTMEDIYKSLQPNLDVAPRKPGSPMEYDVELE